MPGYAFEQTLFVVRSDTGPPPPEPTNVTQHAIVVLAQDVSPERISGTGVNVLLKPETVTNISSTTVTVLAGPAPPEEVTILGQEAGALVEELPKAEIISHEAAALVLQEDKASVTSHEAAALVLAEPKASITSQEMLALVTAHPAVKAGVTSQELVVLVKGGRYRIISEPTVVQPGEYVTFKIICRDGTLGPVDGILELRSNARNAPVYRVDLRSNFIRFV